MVFEGFQKAKKSPQRSKTRWGQSFEAALLSCGPRIFILVRLGWRRGNGTGHWPCLWLRSRRLLCRSIRFHVCRAVHRLRLLLYRTGSLLLYGLSCRLCHRPCRHKRPCHGLVHGLRRRLLHRLCRLLKGSANGLRRLLYRLGRLLCRLLRRLLEGTPPGPVGTVYRVSRLLHRLGWLLHRLLSRLLGCGPARNERPCHRLVHGLRRLLLEGLRRLLERSANGLCRLLCRPVREAGDGTRARSVVFIYSRIHRSCIIQTDRPVGSRPR